MSESADTPGRRYAGNLAKFMNGLQITPRGQALVEAGLSVRHAHELETGCSAENLCDECREATE